MRVLNWVVVVGGSITAVSWITGAPINRFAAVCFAIVVVMGAIRNLLEDSNG